jgi:hypothetical protein
MVNTSRKMPPTPVVALIFVGLQAVLGDQFGGHSRGIFH